MHLVLVSDLLQKHFSSSDLWVSSELDEVSVPIGEFAKALHPIYTVVRWDGYAKLGGIYHTHDVSVDDDNNLIEWLTDDAEPIIGTESFSEGDQMMFLLGKSFDVKVAMDKDNAAIVGVGGWG